MVHVDWSRWTIYWEQHVEGNEYFFSPKDTGLTGNRPAIVPLSSNEFAILAGTTKETERGSLFIRKRNSTEKVFEASFPVYTMGIGRDVEGNAVFCVLNVASNQGIQGDNYIWVYSPNSGKVFSEGPFSGILAGKAFEYEDRNPGCIWTATDGKITIISVNGITR